MPVHITPAHMADLSVTSTDESNVVRFTPKGWGYAVLLLFRIGQDTDIRYRARWVVDPKALPPQVTLDLACAVGMYVLDQRSAGDGKP